LAAAAGPLLLDEIRQLDPVYQFHRKENLPVLRAARFVDRGDARMLQSRQGLDLALEHLDQPIVSPETPADHLQRHKPPRPLLLRLINNAHPALADLAQDAVI